MELTALLLSLWLVDFSRWGTTIIRAYGKTHAHIETVLEYYRNMYLHELFKFTSTHRLAHQLSLKRDWVLVGELCLLLLE